MTDKCEPHLGMSPLIGSSIQGGQPRNQKHINDKTYGYRSL